jgi:hypothetical protein
MMIADAAEGEVLRMGWLKKQKKTWRKWVQLERRYFRLTKDALSYYKTDTEVRCLHSWHGHSKRAPTAGREWGRGGNGRRRAWGGRCGWRGLLCSSLGGRGPEQGERASWTRRHP